MKKFVLYLCCLYAGNAIAQIPNTISPADKVYGLSKFWQEVNYNFVYLNRVDRSQWDSAYKAMISLVEQSADDYEYYRMLQKFCALLKDGHTNVWFPPAIANLQLTRMFGNYWFNLENVEGKAIVTATLRAKMKEIPIGSEVVTVNGVPTEQYIKDSVAPYISSSTGYVLKDWATANLLQGMTGSAYDITIKQPGGKIIPLHLVHTRTTDTSYYPPLQGDSLLEMKWYKNIAYVALNSFGDEKIDTLFINKLPELYKAKALIIDLRKNGGGSTNIGTTILQYLTSDTVLPHARYQTRQHLAAFKAWGKYVEPKDTTGNAWNTKSWLYNHDAMYYSFDYAPDTFHLEARRLVVPTAVLIGHNTASAAEDFLISADGQQHFTKIGERSFGSTGQPFLFDLPGGGSARVCTKKDTYPDGREFVGYGVQPDVEVAPSLKDFIEQKDPVIEAALQYLQNKISR